MIECCPIRPRNSWTHTIIYLKGSAAQYCQSDNLKKLNFPFLSKASNTVNFRHVSSSLDIAFQITMGKWAHCAILSISPAFCHFLGIVIRLLVTNIHIFFCIIFFSVPLNVLIDSTPLLSSRVFFSAKTQSVSSGAGGEPWQWKGFR